ncbi:hypothetical protein [Microbacterium maritypicum]|uniref:Uncharacterized protein n=1 Tax=Microbacterium maritypicum TaxID=33918 RepID=A0ACD4B8D5_MICMQ|nr:hypothetical protein [Microbacterium liquefaciens]UTT53754.1 hypothetical protein NMQ05_04015 [Microbacterium liquefaciens]
MTTIKKVSTSADPDDYRDDQSRAATVSRPGDEGSYFDARVPARSIDSLRKQVRQRRYSSSTEEAEAIRKTDEELFEKVRVAERHTLARADAMLEHNKGRTGQALAFLDKIDELRDRLAAGEDTSVVVKEFNKLDNHIRAREIKVLRGMASEASTVRAALADPVEHAQHLYSLMPIAFGRAAGLVGH